MFAVHLECPRKPSERTVALLVLLVLPEQPVALLLIVVLASHPELLAPQWKFYCLLKRSSDGFAYLSPGFIINLHSSDDFAYLFLFLSQAAPAEHSGSTRCHAQ